MDKEELLLEEYKLTTRDFNHESTLLWQKTYFFVVISGLLFSYSASKFVSESPFFQVILAILGLVISTIWLLIGHRAGEYITCREERALSIENEIKELRIYQTSRECSLKKSRIGRLLHVRPLVTVVLPSVFIILWLMILIYLIIK